MEEKFSPLSAELAAAVDSMQAFPASVQNILRLTRDADCSPKDLVEVIGKDPVVTVKVLRVVNSAYYSLTRPITSLDHAVVFLGFNTVKNLALSFAAVGMLPSSPIAGFAGQQYLLHSLACAGIARQLAARFASADPNAFFIGGLLHDFGKVVVAQAMPEAYRQATEACIWNETSLYQSLLELARVDTGEVGALLLQRWRFPAELVDAIRWQHALHDHLTPMTAALFAANQMSKKLGVDFGGSVQPEQVPEALTAMLGATLDELLQSGEDWQGVVLEARRFARL